MFWALVVSSKNFIDAFIHSNMPENIINVIVYTAEQEFVIRLRGKLMFISLRLWKIFLWAVSYRLGIHGEIAMTHEFHCSLLRKFFARFKIFGKAIHSRFQWFRSFACDGVCSFLDCKQRGIANVNEACEKIHSRLALPDTNLDVYRTPIMRLCELFYAHSVTIRQYKLLHLFRAEITLMFASGIIFVTMGSDGPSIWRLMEFCTEKHRYFCAHEYYIRSAIDGRVTPSFFLLFDVVSRSCYNRSALPFAKVAHLGMIGSVCDLFLVEKFDDSAKEFSYKLRFAIRQLLRRYAA